jgi:dihydroorotate dehydrogenase (fumarate)
MVGAGPVKLPEHVLEIANSHAAAIIVGSITIEPRKGNDGTTYFADPNQRFALNSKGLPNPGVDYYRDVLPVMAQMAHDHGKPLIVSTAGFSPSEYARLAEVALEGGADGIELNLGCPNVWGPTGEQKQIASFSEDLTGETLQQVERLVHPTDKWVAVKVSPFSDPSKLKSIAEIIAQSQMVRAVTSTNTFPNALALDKEQLREVLPDAIAVVGVGGIKNTQDVRDYLRAGAEATQITTAYINFGPSIFAVARGLSAEG